MKSRKPIIDKPEHITLKYKKSRINCLKVGTGKELLVAFHGYGDRASLFAQMVKRMPERFTLYAIDLPIHGKSEWKGKRIEGDVYVWMIRQVLELEKAVYCSLMGFSYGGRIVLYLTEKVPYLVKNIYLIGPDGIVVSGLYRAVQKVPEILKRLSFKILINGQTARFTKSLYKRGWINHHNYRFSEVNFATRKKRRRLLVYWMSLRNVDPNWDKVRKKIVKHKIQMKIFLGTHDEIIPSRAGRMISDEVTDAEVVFLNANHKQLNRVFFQRAEQLLASK